MNVTWAVAILSATVTALGWLVTYIFTISAESRRHRLISQMEFTRQQIKELYGPLAFLILEGRQTARDLNDSLNWDPMSYKDEPLTEQERQTWFFWVENDFFPRNQKIKELLSNKTYLIEGESIPKSFLEFLDHYNSWYINDLRRQKQGVEYGWHSKIPWPATFGEDVLSAFSELKKRHAILIGMISETPSLRHYILRKFRHKIPQKLIDQKNE